MFPGSDKIDENIHITIDTAIYLELVRVTVSLYFIVYNLSNAIDATAVTKATGRTASGGAAIQCGTVQPLTETIMHICMTP